jgi:hypothetical protein
MAYQHISRIVLYLLTIPYLVPVQVLDRVLRTPLSLAYYYSS